MITKFRLAFVLSLVASQMGVLLAAQVVKAETLTVAGQTFEATNVETYSDGKKVSNFNVVKPVTFTMARGNKIIARELVFLDREGKISVISSPDAQQLDWASPSGVVAHLDCGKRKATPRMPESSRIISFYADQEYKSGCALIEPFEFTVRGQAITVRGSLDVTPDFQLHYTSDVVKGVAVIDTASPGQGSVIGTKSVKLEPGKEASFFENGAPEFITLQAQEHFRETHPIYGPLEFGQFDRSLVATSFSANHLVTRGVVKAPFVHKETGLEVPAESGLIFDDEGQTMVGVIFPAPEKIKVKNYDVSATRFTYNLHNTFLVLTVAETFTFRNPKRPEQTLKVDPGSELDVSSDMEITGIRIPRAPRPN